MEKGWPDVGSDAPLRILQPGSRPPALSPRTLFAHRDLLITLTTRQVAGRYRQTLLGVFWALLQPLLTMVVFSLLLGRYAGVPSAGLPYPVFVFLGLLPWQLFQNALSRGTASFVANTPLVTRVYFPRALLVFSSVLASVVDFLLATLVLVGIAIWYAAAPAPSALWLAPLVLWILLLAAGLGLGLAALHARVRDVGHALPFFLQVGMFASPVVYPAEVVPSSLHTLYALNPAAGPIHAFRAAFVGAPLDGQLVALSALSGLLLLAGSVALFLRLERRLADVI